MPIAVSAKTSPLLSTQPLETLPHVAEANTHDPSHFEPDAPLELRNELAARSTLATRGTARPRRVAQQIGGLIDTVDGQPERGKADREHAE